MNPIAPRPVGRLALALGLVAGVWFDPSTSGADTASVGKPVSYAADQADRGEKKYKKECLECHGKNLKGGLNGGAPIRGAAFMNKFAEGAPASALFQYMSSLMPPNSPGRFSANTYADLMAYVLKRNGFKEGEPLPSDLDALDGLIMEK